MVDALAYVLRVLGESGRARYRSLLQHVVDRPEGNSKLARYAKNAIEKLANEQVEQFPFSDSR